MYKITFYNIDINDNLKNKKHIKTVLTELFKKEKTKIDTLSIIFCSDNHLLEMNKKFLNHNYLTDILTFRLNENESLQGELYISVDRIKENAKTFLVSYQNELLRVIVHGCLHLCNYNDSNKHEKKQMQQLEDFYLQRYIDSRET